MVDAEASSLGAAASRAAAALVAALQQPPSAGGAAEVAAAAFGADPEVLHCSIAVVLDGGSAGGAICSSGNLLRTHEVGLQLGGWAAVNVCVPLCTLVQMPLLPLAVHPQASTLHCGASSLAGSTILLRRPKLLHGRLPRCVQGDCVSARPQSAAVHAENTGCSKCMQHVGCGCAIC